MQFLRLKFSQSLLKDPLGGKFLPRKIAVNLRNFPNTSGGVDRKMNFNEKPFPSHPPKCRLRDD